ncbi:hypothetical protein SLS61_001937 [Didymella pomorum]
MRGAAITTLTGLASLVSAQSIDLEYVNSLPDPTYTILPDQRAQTVTYDQATAIASVAAEALQSPVPDPGESDLHTRDLALEKRGGPCDDLNNNVNAYNAVLDPAESFLADTNLANEALNARTPSGYTRVYQNLKKSAQANGYMGPSQVPAPACPDPRGAANPFCVLWGGPVSEDNARNEGQWRDQYHVVIAASNGYVLTSSLNPLSSKAISAPVDCNNDDAYMGMRLLTDNAPFDPQRCAAICDATSQYNIDHPGDPSVPPRLCKFYNTYILNKNYISQGQACSMYTQYWNPSVYATNDGQWDGQGNRYTISSSVFFYNTTDVVTPVCPVDITRLQSNADAGAFCTSYNSYVAPLATTVTTYTSTTTIAGCGPTNRVKRNGESGAVVHGVVAVYPSKVADSDITGTVPALVTVPAERLSDAGAVASATAAAISQLGASDSEPASAPPTGASTAAPPATTTAAVAKRAVATPAIFAGRDPRQISSACSRVIGTGPSTVTVKAVATEVVSNIIAGSFTSATEDYDDWEFAVTLPFEICIYSKCSTTAHPSTNGLITLGSYGTEIYNNEIFSINHEAFHNEAILFAFYDDLQIYRGQQHYMSYRICGAQGQRSITFEWRVGRWRAPANGPLYKFSATFYEGKPSLIKLRYFSTTDQGSSASIGMQGYYNGQYKSYVYSQDQAVIPGNYELTWDPATNFFAPTRTNN